jgi:hypothetical protein
VMYKSSCRIEIIYQGKFSECLGKGCYCNEDPTDWSRCSMKSGGV